MRNGRVARGNPVSGIEAAGTVGARPQPARSPREQRVVALMGGLGRTRNGSYAEYVAAPATNVATIDTSLSWTDLAAIPESYATAWSALARQPRAPAGPVARSSAARPRRSGRRR